MKNSSLPVTVRVSKTRVLKLPINELKNSGKRESALGLQPKFEDYLPNGQCQKIIVTCLFHDFSGHQKKDSLHFILEMHMRRNLFSCQSMHMSRLSATNATTNCSRFQLKMVQLIAALSFLLCFVLFFSTVRVHLFPQKDQIAMTMVEQNCAFKIKFGIQIVPGANA